LPVNSRSDTDPDSLRCEAKVPGEAAAGICQPDDLILGVLSSLPCSAAAGPLEESRSLVELAPQSQTLGREELKFAPSVLGGFLEGHEGSHASGAKWLDTSTYSQTVQECLKVASYFPGGPATGIIDTGSRLTCARESVASKAGVSTMVLDPPVDVYTANGQKLKSHRYAMIEPRLGCSCSADKPLKMLVFLLKDEDLTEYDIYFSAFAGMQLGHIKIRHCQGYTDSVSHRSMMPSL